MISDSHQNNGTPDVTSVSQFQYHNRPKNPS
eukprot:CAMPEP_0202974826 /NCGR_PEP_ID=MMETSP1396-20130829/64404_1 /ASSEMBLY_ACC=CAM_ASM_000872 /TAXON_ID= /ORGANISM="Pseudokeronopsis sp., Strain Brazil" /LENGTH=30 /DNA_ID= /DNA_START= /DNA_END= /DNA_ORIENTATION=